MALLQTRTTGRYDLNPPQFLAATGRRDEIPIVDAVPEGQDRSASSLAEGAEAAVAGSAVGLASAAGPASSASATNIEGNRSAEASDARPASARSSVELDEHLAWLFDGNSPPWMPLMKEVTQLKK